MKKINLTTVFKVLIALTLLAIILLLVNCPGTKTIPTPNTTKEDSIIQKADVNIAVIHAKKDILKDADSFYEKERFLLLSEIDKLKTALSKERKKAKTFSDSDVVKYFEERYNMPNSAKSTAYGTELSDTLTFKTIDDLIVLDFTKKELEHKNRTIKVYDNELKGCDSINKLNEDEIKSLNDKYFASESKVNKFSESLDKANKELNKEVKFRLLGGFEYGNNLMFSNQILKANISGQLRNGNIIRASVDNNQNYYLGYDFSIFEIKGKKK
jgi:hypothetical protein